MKQNETKRNKMKQNETKLEQNETNQNQIGVWTWTSRQAPGYGCLSDNSNIIINNNNYNL
jgi:hypothetical protein